MKFTRLQLIVILGAIIGFGVGVLIQFSGDSTPAIQEVAIEPAGTIPDYDYNPIQKIQDPELLNEIENSLKININSASSEELQQLHRVGSKTAEAIIKYRNEHGPFLTLDQLTAIRGIGPKTVARIRQKAICGPYQTTDMETTDADLSPSPSLESVRSPSSDSAPKSNGCTIGQININRATQEELITLPRIGPATADKIITYRDENGPFSSVDDLTKVKGIGSKTLERLKELICAE